MSKPKVALTLPLSAQDSYLCDEARQILESCAQVRWNQDDRTLTEEEKSEWLREMEGLVTGWGDSGLTEANIAAAKNLRIIGLIGASVKKISPGAALDRGIIICNTAPALGDSVAEFSLTLILCLLKQILPLDQEVKKGGWRPNIPPGQDLTGKTVGLVGCGTIGKKLVELLQPFQCQILVYDPYLPAEDADRLGVSLLSLEELLQRSEVITLHAGMTQETYHLIGKEQLDLIQEGAILVNTARGNLLDEQALTAKLKEGKIWAALDVFAPEPPPADSELRKLPNVILTPHSAAVTQDTFYRVGMSVATDLQLFFSGQQPLHQLTREQIHRAT